VVSAEPVTAIAFSGSARARSPPREIREPVKDPEFGGIPKGA
jgi:hypothetical protein